MRERRQEKKKDRWAVVSTQLFSTHTQTLDTERRLRDAGGVALALAVLAAFARLPGAADSEDALRLAPQWCKVSGREEVFTTHQHAKSSRCPPAAYSWTHGQMLL